MSTKPVCQLDAEGYFVGLTDADESPLEPGVWLIPAGAVDAPVPVVSSGFRARWNGGQFVLEVIPAPPPAPEPPVLSQFERDKLRYQRRAAVKDQLLAEMAAENMARVRSGTWTVADLTGLMQDATLKTTLDLIGTLSYEMAAQSLAASTNPLLTPAIKAGWVSKLQANFYLEP